MQPQLKEILLIDDMRSDNFLTSRIIRKAGVAETITVMTDGPSALDYLGGTGKASPGQPEVILLDINMPGMNGWEFLEGYRELPAAQRRIMTVCMLTTSRSAEDLERATAHPLVRAFFTKPLQREDVLEIVRLSG